MTDAPPPIALLAELTHRCPLKCPYCSNPLALTRRSAELDTESWARVFAEAAEIGVLQLHLSGGEPAARRDLVALTAAAARRGLYTNLITSGLGLTEPRLRALEDAGLDHVQLSLQGVDADSADRIAGRAGAFERKLAVAALIRDLGFPLTVNMVMHRLNLDGVARAIDMAAALGARRIEVACVQFHGWAARNRAALQPTRAQVARAKTVVAERRAALKGALAIDFVPPDYFADYPKACMGGWGSTGLVVAPDGRALPCHGADGIPGLAFQSVRDAHLGAIWRDDPAFNAFRGVDWMVEPCRSCARKTLDFGGCRCQAAAIAGDPSAADPVCRLAPDRPKIDAMLSADAAADAALVYRA